MLSVEYFQFLDRVTLFEIKKKKYVNCCKNCLKIKFNNKFVILNLKTVMLFRKKNVIKR